MTTSNLTRLTLSPVIMKALAWEQLRKRLVDQSEFLLAELTYLCQSDFLPDQNTGQFWDQKFTQDVDNHYLEHWRTKVIIDQIDPAKSLLNLGVGRGFLEQRLFEKFPEISYTGTDITDETLEKLRQRFGEQRSFLHTPLNPLPLPDSSFDQVLLLEVLEHIKPNETFSILQEIFRVLKPGGTVIISVPVNEGLCALLPDNPNSHMRLYSESLLRFELETTGFLVDHIYRASAFKSWFWLKHWLNSRGWWRQPNNLICICRKP